MPRSLKRVSPGEPITAAWANAITDEVSAIGRFSAAPPLELSRDAAGYRIKLATLLKIEVFELSEDLASGSSAEANILAFDGTSWNPAATATIVVVDALGSFEGTLGDRGIAFLHRQSSLWIVLQLQCP